VHSLFRARSGAYVLDCLVYLGLAAATVPLGMVFQQQGWGQVQGLVLAVSVIPPVAATVLAGVQESGPRAATFGKRPIGLEVRTTAGERVSRGRALLRNAVKIGIPWQLGHLVAIGSTFGGFQGRDPLTLVAAAIIYPLMVVMVVLVARGSGRGLHDRLAGTQVGRAA
jgi:uncharacterized RDD family membrane protein YckC